MAKSFARAFVVGAILSVLLLAPTAATAQQKKQGKKPLLPASVEVIRDVEFGKGGGRALKMHIIRPKQEASEPRPVLVWIHGGGWIGGNKESGIIRSTLMAREGYFCATIEYRLSKEAVFPAQIEDCKCAIRFLRAKAKEYNIDPNRIGVWGASAGGHLVSLLGTTANLKNLEGKGGYADQPSNVQCVVDFCGPSDLIRITKNSKSTVGLVATLLGGSIDQKRDLAKLASPINHVDKNDAPFLIVHGDKDNLVPLDQAQIFADALKQAGVPVTLHIAEGQGHGLGGPQIAAAVSKFFNANLKNK